MSEEDNKAPNNAETAEASEASADREYLDGFLSGEAGSDVAAESETPAPDDQDLVLRAAVIASIREIFDPEIPVNIYDLGLIYEVEANDDGDVVVTMTLTTPHCPVAESMPADVEVRVRDVEGVATARVNLVWDPPWEPSRMTEEAQLELGFI